MSRPVDVPPLPVVNSRTIVGVIVNAMRRTTVAVTRGVNNLRSALKSPAAERTARSNPHIALAV